MKWQLLAFGIVAALLAAGCGSQQSGSSPAGGSASTPQQATAVEATVQARVQATTAAIPAPKATPKTAAPSAFQPGVVTHTFGVTSADGQGAALRSEPGGEAIRHWPDGTRMEVAGYRQDENSVWWAVVRDPAGNEGWVRRDQLGAPPPQAPLSVNPNTVSNGLPRGATLASAPGSVATVQPAPPGGPKVLYQADWSQGLSTWTDKEGRPLEPGWKIADGMLVSDGSSTHAAAYAPFRPGKAGIKDYAVEASIQIVGWNEIDCFTLTAHQDPLNPCVVYGSLQLLPQGGLLYPHAGILTTDNLNYVIGTGPFVPLLPKQSPVTIQPGEWHSYRLLVQGSKVQWSIDGYVFAEFTDNRKVTGGLAGLWLRCGSPRIAVRTFRIVEP